MILILSYSFLCFLFTTEIRQIQKEACYHVFFLKPSCTVQSSWELSCHSQLQVIHAAACNSYTAGGVPCNFPFHWDGRKLLGPKI